MISRRSNEIRRASNVLDGIAAWIGLGSRVSNLTDDITLFPFDGLEVSSAARVRTFDELDVSADKLEVPSNVVEIPAPAIVMRFDAQRTADDFLESSFEVQGSPPYVVKVSFDRTDIAADLTVVPADIVTLRAPRPALREHLCVRRAALLVLRDQPS